jgi:hypothetical protein
MPGGCPAAAAAAEPAPELPLVPLAGLPADTRVELPGLGPGNSLRCEQRGRVRPQPEHCVRLDAPPAAGAARELRLRGHKRAAPWVVVRAPLMVRSGLAGGAAHAVVVGPGMTVRQLLLLLGELCGVPAHCQRLTHAAAPDVLFPTAAEPGALLSALGIHQVPTPAAAGSARRMRRVRPYDADHVDLWTPHGSLCVDLCVDLWEPWDAGNARRGTKGR